MTVSDHGLGGRLPLVDPAAMTGPQRDLYDRLNASWVPFADRMGVRATDGGGCLIGPFNAFLLHPEVTAKLSEFQATEEALTTLPARVREVVILTVGAVWRAEYELYARGHVAREAGLSDRAIATLADGGLPEELGEPEKLAARLARALCTQHRVDDDLYRQAEQAFGPRGLFDIVAVMGVYQTVCAALGLFEVPAPGPS